jgi:branched-chain amino acid aminotransferase
MNEARATRPEPPTETLHGVLVERTRSPLARPSASSKLGFGVVFTDHLLTMDHDATSGWGAPRIVPAGNATASVASGALQYSLSAFEGLKVFRSAGGGPARLFRPDAHGRRLAESARRLCLPPLDPAIFVRLVSALACADADWCPPPGKGAIYIRPTLFASEAFLGVRPARQHRFVVIASPVDSYWADGEHPLRLWAETEHVRAAPGGTGAAKTGGNYASSLLAARRAQERGFDQVLWLDSVTRQRVEEAGTMNFFARLGDRVVTPPLDGTILAGVTRDSSLALLKSWGVPVEERAVTLSELAGAAGRGELVEMWGSGTAAVIAPISELAWEGQVVRPSGGDLAMRLRAAIEGIQNGTAPDPFGWTVPVDAPETHS